MAKLYLNPESLFPSQQYGFSQGVVAQGRKTVYLSGQVAWNAGQDIGDARDLGTQAQRALENVERALQGAGATRTDVVSLRIYIVGEHMHNAFPVREALLRFFPEEQRPASTWIGVPALASPDFLIEIEAVAVIE